MHRIIVLFIYLSLISFINCTSYTRVYTDPIGYKIVTDSYFIDVDENLCINADFGYVFAVLTFEDSINPLKLDTVELYEFNIFDTTKHEVTFKQNLQKIDKDTFLYAPLLNYLLEKIKNKIFYIPESEYLKGRTFFKRTGHNFIFRKKQNLKSKQ